MCNFAAKLTNNEKIFYTSYSLYGYDINCDSSARHKDSETESD